MSVRYMSVHYMLVHYMSVCYMSVPYMSVSVHYMLVVLVRLVVLGMCACQYKGVRKCVVSRWEGGWVPGSVGECLGRWVGAWEGGCIRE